MENKPGKSRQRFNNYMRYSGIGFQIAGSLALGVFIGYELDKWQHTRQPYFTMFFSILFLFAGLYSVFKDLMKNE